jgi:hypothetical protein
MGWQVHVNNVRMLSQFKGTEIEISPLTSVLHAVGMAPVNTVLILLQLEWCMMHGTYGCMVEHWEGLGMESRTLDASAVRIFTYHSWFAVPQRKDKEYPTELLNYTVWPLWPTELPVLAPFRAALSGPICTVRMC